VVWKDRGVVVKARECLLEGYQLMNNLVPHKHLTICLLMWSDVSLNMLLVYLADLAAV